jgi:hypothetical protein
MSTPPTGPIETPYYNIVRREAESIGNALVGAMMRGSEVEEMLLARWIRNSANEIIRDHSQDRLSIVKDIVSNIYDHTRYTHYGREIEMLLNCTLIIYEWGFRVSDVVERHVPAEAKGPKE